MSNPLDEVVEESTDVVGRVLMVAPSDVTSSAIDHLIAKLRQDRALFIKKDLSKGDPKDVTPKDEEAETDQAPE
jgi:hypothetical protein